MKITIDTKTLEIYFGICEVEQRFIEGIVFRFSSNDKSLLLNKYKFGDVSRIFKGEDTNLIFLSLKQYTYDMRYFKEKVICSMINVLKDLYFSRKNVMLSKINNKMQ